MRPVLPLLLALALARSAAAQPAAPATTPDAAAEAKRHAQAGTVAYRLAHFDEALAEYEEAYRLKPVPGLLFNIGQCHYQLGRTAKAIFFWESYLRSEQDKERRAVVEAQLEEARARLATEEARDKTAAEERAQREARDERVDSASNVERARLEAERAKAEAERAKAERALADQRAAQQAADEDGTAMWVAVGGAVAGAVLLAAGAVTTTVVLWPAPTVPPSGTLGSIDRR